MRFLIPIVPLFFSTSVFAQYLCTASSQGMPEFEDGLLFSKEVELHGKQGTAAGRILLHRENDLAFYLTAGTTMTINAHTQLISFYAEVQDAKRKVNVRSMSGEVDGVKQARLEFITYPAGSYLFQGMIDFQCQYF